MEMAEPGATGEVPSRSPRLDRRLVLGLVSFAASGVGLSIFVSLRSDAILDRIYPVSPSRLVLEVDARSARVERGRHLGTTLTQCTFCHGPDLGGREIADDPWIGRLHAPNLTRGLGGVAREYTTEDWVRALRHGLSRDQRSLLLMPTAGLARLSDADLAAIIAWVESVPPIDRQRPPTWVGPLARLALALDRAPGLVSAQDALGVAAQRGEVSRDASSAYGEYLVAVSGCRVCHHENLEGGLHPLALPGEPVPPNITATGPLGSWTLEEFALAIRRGQTPDGRLLDRDFMPWPSYAGLEDVEIEALWHFLREDDLSVRVATATRTEREVP